MAKAGSPGQALRRGDRAAWLHRYCPGGMQVAVPVPSSPEWWDQGPEGQPGGSGQPAGPEGDFLLQTISLSSVGSSFK